MAYNQREEGSSEREYFFGLSFKQSCLVAGFLGVTHVATFFLGSSYGKMINQLDGMSESITRGMSLTFAEQRAEKDARFNELERQIRSMTSPALDRTVEELTYK